MSEIFLSGTYNNDQPINQSSVKRQNLKKKIADALIHSTGGKSPVADSLA
jgi:hypothetical protein